MIGSGVNTNACIEMTSKDAEDHGYWVYLAEDACAAFAGEQAHKSTIKRLDSGNLLRVVSTTKMIHMRKMAKSDATFPGFKVMNSKI